MLRSQLKRPRISASDLNAFQDAIIALFSNGQTVKSLTADATGGQTQQNPVAGRVMGQQLQASTAAGSNSGGTGLVPGQAFKDTMPFAAGSFALGGTSWTWGVNAGTITRNNAGDYSVAYKNSATNGSWVMPAIEAPDSSRYVTKLYSTSKDGFRVLIFDANASPADITGKLHFIAIGY